MNETVNSIMTYLKGVRAEWGKISWPERQQVFGETLSVIVIVVVFTIAVFAMDSLFGFIAKHMNHYQL